MKYIIYGAGHDGREACENLGCRRVSYFCDANHAGSFIDERRVLSVEDMLAKYATGNYIVVIASSRYQLEMEMVLKSKGVERYFIYTSNVFYILPRYYPYYPLYGKILTMGFSELMMNYRINQYNHIAISSINIALPYLISEILFQCQTCKIDYIIDDNAYCEYTYMGIPVVHSKQALPNIDCLVINVPCKKSDIRDRIPINPSFKIVDCYDTMRLIPENRHPELVKYKDIHKGERCFIIGNGPSLTIEDLETLHKHNEVTFGVNYIFKCFGQTKWRPKYYVSVDFDASSFPEADIYNYVGRDKTEAFYSDSVNWRTFSHGIIADRNCMHVEVVDLNTDKSLPRFSDDITYGTYVAYTVLYNCIQIANYMGFKEIYLIGADTNYSGDKGKDHFVENYHSDQLIEKLNYDEPNALSYESDGYGVRWHQSMLNAFKKAELYSREHEFRIYNATRGGSLEEFERVNFDSLFN